MKYVNPEYVSILVNSVDVITTSVWSQDIIFDEPKDYTQTKDYYVNEETGEIEKIGTTISANLSSLGI